MERQKIAILDLSECKYVGQLHQMIKDTLCFPDYYGENWDAFYDLMCMECSVEKLIICGTNSMALALLKEVEQMCLALEDVKVHHREYSLIFDYEVKDE